MEIPGGWGLKQKCPMWEGGMDIFWNYTIFAKNGLEIIRHRIRINMKRKIFSHFMTKNYLSHDNIVQQHF